MLSSEWDWVYDWGSRIFLLSGFLQTSWWCLSIWRGNLGSWGRILLFSSCWRLRFWCVSPRMIVSKGWYWTSGYIFLGILWGCCNFCRLPAVYLRSFRWLRWMLSCSSCHSHWRGCVGSRRWLRSNWKIFFWRILLGWANSDRYRVQRIEWVLFLWGTRWSV